MASFSEIANRMGLLGRSRGPTGLTEFFARPGRRLFLCLALAPVGLAFLSFLLINVVDPYALRPWGTASRLDAMPAEARLTPRLLNLVAASDVDVLVVGGSTLAPISPANLREAFGATRPFNLAYDGPLPGDQKLVLDRALAMPKLKRVLIGLDFTQLLPAAEVSRHFPHRLFTRRWFDFGVDFDPMTVRLAARLVFARRAEPAGEARSPVTPPRLTAQPAALARLAVAIAAHRQDVAAPAGRACADIDAVARVLAPFAAAAAKRGVLVDVVAPPYATAAYYDWLARPPPRYFLRRPDAVLDQIVTLRRCATLALAPFANTRVHVFDNEDAITSRLANYKDTTHLVELAVFRQMLAYVAARGHVLTPETFEAFAARLVERVRLYDIGKDGR